MNRSLNQFCTLLGILTLAVSAHADGLWNENSMALRAGHGHANFAPPDSPPLGFCDPGMACGSASCDTVCPCDCPAECDTACLPRFHCHPGNLVPHTPYCAEPKLYYYFRPYSWHHVEEQVESVLRFGGDPRHPYANREFAEIYRGLE
jgi:hypothetical protein